MPFRQVSSVKDDLRVVFYFTLGGENVSRNSIPGFARGKLLSHPVAKFSCLLVRLGTRIPSGRQFRGANPIPPGTAELLTKLGCRQQRIDQRGPLIRLLAVKKFCRLAGRGYAAGQVEIDTTQELGVIARRGWLELGGCQELIDMLVNCFSDVVRFVPLIGR